MLRPAVVITALALGALGATASGAAVTPSPAAGGSFGRSAVEGCMNEYLFDGVWRFKVLSVDPAASYNDGTQNTGVGVKVQLRNGTSKDLAADSSGLSDINGTGISLAYSDENTVNLANAGGITENLLDKKLPPGAPATVTLYFPYGPDKTAKPAKLIVPVDPKSSHNYSHVTYSVKDPSFRIHLDCSK